MGGVLSALREKLSRGGIVWMVVFGGIGILLLLFGGRSGSAATDAAETRVERDAAREMEVYTEAMEEKIRAICESVSGISGVRVVVTLASGYEYVYAKDGEAVSSGDKINATYQYLTVGNGSNEKTVYLSERAPTVAGIGIVCRGGGDPTRKKELLLLISAAFGVPSNKIYITEGG